MTNADLYDAALGWIGTPFRHQGRRKGEAIDCAGLLIGVQREVFGTIFDFTSYREVATVAEARRWLEEFCDLVIDRLPEKGDVLLFERFYRGGSMPHMAFLDPEQNRMVMACAQSGKVQEVEFSDKWRRRMIGLYRRKPERGP